MILIGAFLFAWGVQAHKYGLIAVGMVVIAIAAINGSKGRFPSQGH